MDFAQHLAGYYKGEWREAALLTIFGLIASGLAVVLWRQADQHTLLKGLFYPVAFLAVFTVLAGGLGVYNNCQRLAAMPTQYAQNPAAFVQAEHTRFEGKGGVNTWWMPLTLLWTAVAVVGIALSFSTSREVVRGVGIGLIFIAAMGFLIDGFAHRRAKHYTSQLLKHHQPDRALHP